MFGSADDVVTLLLCFVVVFSSVVLDGSSTRRNIPVSNSSLFSQPLIGIQLWPYWTFSRRTYQKNTVADWLPSIPFTRV